MNKKHTFYINLFVFSLFLILISPYFLSRGMFVDGVVYANISKNFAIGKGTFFHPFYSQTYLTNFTSHPPMFFFLQGVVFKIFGTSFLVEKIYSVLSILITTLIMIKIYRKVELKNSFLPALFFLIIPLTYWSATNNIIENTLMILTTLSVLFYLLSLEKKKYLFLTLSCLSIIIGFSLKGFVALFPIVFPIFYLIINKTKPKRAIWDTVFISAFVLIFYLFVFSLSKEAKDYFVSYFNIQILGDMINKKVVSSRFYILWRFIGEILIIPILIGIYILIYYLRRKSKPIFNKSNNRVGLMFLLFSLSGVLPLMLTMKQSGFYLLPTFPFVAIGLAAFIDENIEKTLQIKLSSLNSRILKLTTVFIFVFSIILSLSFYGKDNRDKELLHDMDIISNQIPENSIINTMPQMETEYSLFAYYARFHNISIDLDIRNEREYILIKKEFDNSIIKSQYKSINLDTKSHYLYKKRRK